MGSAHIYPSPFPPPAYLRQDGQCQGALPAVAQLSQLAQQLGVGRQLARLRMQKVKVPSVAQAPLRKPPHTATCCTTRSGGCQLARKCIGKSVRTTKWPHQEGHELGGREERVSQRGLTAVGEGCTAGGWMQQLNFMQCRRLLHSIHAQQCR